MPYLRAAGVGRDLLALAVAGAAGISVAAPSTLAWPPMLVAVGGVVVLIVRGHRPSPAETALGLLTVATALSLLWTVSAEATTAALLTQAGAFLAFFLVRLAARDPRGWKAAGVGYVAGCLVAVIVIWQQSGLRLTFGFDTNRAVLENINPNHLAYAMCVGLILLAALRRVRVLPVLIAWPLAVLLLLGINQAGTRGALVALIGLLVWLVVHRANRTLAFRCLVALAGAAAILSLTGAADDRLRTYITASTRESGDLNGRLTMWPFAREVYEDNPWLGIGAGAFREVNPMEIVAHNAVLEVATGLGAVGVILFGVAMFFAFVTSTRHLKTRDRGIYAGGLLALVLPILLSGHWHQAPALWVALALVTRLDVVLGARRGEVQVSDNQPDRAPREVARFAVTTRSVLGM